GSVPYPRMVLEEANPARRRMGRCAETKFRRLPISGVEKPGIVARAAELRRVHGPSVAPLDRAGHERDMPASVGVVGRRERAIHLCGALGKRNWFRSRLLLGCQDDGVAALGEQGHHALEVPRLLESVEEEQD